MTTLTPNLAVLVPLAKLRPHPANPRTITNAAFERLKRALEADPAHLWQRPLAARSDGTVYSGNMRLLALQKLGWADAPVVYEDLPPKEEDLRRLRDNASYGEDDEDALAELLHRLKEQDADLTLTGYDDATVAALLAAVSDDGVLLTPSVDNEATGTPSGDGERRATLAERFGVPPFSVLDARQGYWQARKRAWLALGIQSELGRGESTLDFSASAVGITDPDQRAAWNATRRADPKRAKNETTLGAIAPNQATGVSPEYRDRPGNNGLLGFSEQARGHYKDTPGLCYTGQDSLNRLQGAKMGARPPHGPTVTQNPDGTLAYRPSNASGARAITTQEWVQGHDIAGAAGNQSGTSVFDPVLCELAYRWFCPPGGTVLDPFAGGSVRGVVAARLGRQYVGYDLSARQIDANREQADALQTDPVPVWQVGDSRGLLPFAPDADFLFTCPPYADLERYSDDPLDLSAMGYPAFLVAYRDIVAKGAERLRPDRFACVVVGDVRDPRGNYRNFVGDTVAAFRDAGLELYNEAILVTAVGSLPIRVGRQFEAGRKLGKTHQNVLVFLKGDARRATAAVGPVECGELLEEATAE